MYRSTSPSFLLTLIVGAVLGVFPDAADSQSTQTRTGSIEMRIVGAGDDVRFFVDGKQVASRKRTASWYAAQAVVEVPAGEHKVEAQFRPPGRDTDGEWSRLSTREPLVVTPGAVVRLEADVRSAGSGKPEDTGRYFHVSTTPGSGAASLAATSSTVAAAGASVEADVPPPAAGEVASVPTITIIGTEVLSDGTTASATTDPLDRGTGEFRYDAPTVAELPPPPDGIAIVQAGRIEISFLVQSVPPGAEASLDGQLVGKTPLHVKLDPRRDHLLSVAHAGCESIVQLLATDEWRAGRSPQALMHLDCK